MTVGLGFNEYAENALVKFKAFEKKYSTGPDEASGIAQGLFMGGVHKSSLVFTDVVISRATFSRITEGKFNLALHMFSYDGPISTQQFLKMMRYNKKLPNEEVGEYFDRCSGISKL